MRNKKKTRSTRLPPSIPKCVKRCEDGYCTSYVYAKPLNTQTAFMFQKTPLGYLIYFKSTEDRHWRSAATDIAISPSSRIALKNSPTLKEAITAVENYIGCSLPDVR